MRTVRAGPLAVAVACAAAAGLTAGAGLPLGAAPGGAPAGALGAAPGAQAPGRTSRATTVRTRRSAGARRCRLRKGIVKILMRRQPRGGRPRVARVSWTLGG